MCVADQYVPPAAPRELPPAAELPRRVTQLDVKAMFPRRIELQGYDPVAYKDGLQRSVSLFSLRLSSLDDHHVLLTPYWFTHCI